ncbi:hypothetical protein ABKN59_006218 [Abortiporus biennis]
MTVFRGQSSVRVYSVSLQPPRLPPAALYFDTIVRLDSLRLPTSTKNGYAFQLVVAVRLRAATAAQLKSHNVFLR